MNRFLAAVRAIAILLVSWAALLGVGFLAGVFPPKRADTTSATRAGEPIASEDAGVAARAEPDASVAATGPAAPRAPATPQPPDAPEAGTPPVPAVPVATAPKETLPRYVGCSGAVEPTIATLAHRPGERPLLFLGCGGNGEVIGFAGGVPLRVARVRVPVGAMAPAVRRLRAISADATGDGVTDWIFGTLRATAVGAPQSGSLHLLRGDGRGAFESPTTLAPVAVADLAAGALDGDAALDLVVLHQPDAAGRRASEAWVFRGGAAPVRSAKFSTSGTATSLALLALDADEALDLLVGGIGTPSLRAHFGDGTGKYPRSSTVAAPPVSGLTLGDLDSDGFADALVEGSGVRIVRGHGSDPSLGATAIEGLPELRSVRALDFDDDHDLDLIGLSPNADVVLARRGADGTYAVETLLSLPRDGGRILDVFVADLAFGPKPELVVLVERDPSTHAREWLFVRDATSSVSSVLADTTTSVDDAPLSLAIELR